MTSDQKILQLFYAGVLADSVKYFDKAGILEDVVKEKYSQQEAAAYAQLKQLNITSIKDLFLRFSEIFGCINWIVDETENGISAIGNSCLLCAISKKIGTVKPCTIYCINPFKALVKSLDPKMKLKVKETLWEGEKCNFQIGNM